MSAGKTDRKKLRNSKRLAWSSLLTDLVRYMDPGDYVSHQSALFLHGFLFDSPAVVHVISAKRHRNRQLHGIDIRFVYRRNLEAEKISAITSTFTSVLVADPALAWLDMLDDLEYAPEMHELARLAQVLPVKTVEILETAASISDTVLKRAAFFLGWCGRLRNLDRICKTLKRTPVKLDYRYESREILWEKRLKVFFPVEILEVPVSHCADKIAEWSILRNSAGFIAALKRQKSLILRDDAPEDCELTSLVWPAQPVGHAFLADWLAQLGLAIIDRDFQTVELKSIGKWLRNFISTDLQRTSLLATAKTFSREIATDINTCTGLLIVALATANLSLLEHAVYNWGEPLFYHGKAGLLVLAFFMLEDFAYGEKTRAIITTALVARGLIAEASAFWKALKLPAKKGWGWIYLAEAATTHRNGDVVRAKKCYELAANAFNKEKNQRMGQVSRVYLGNLLLGEQKYIEARAVYTAVLEGQTQDARLSDNFQGVLLGNLGIVEFRLGQLKSAEKLLAEAIPLSRLSANESAVMLFLFYQASSQLYLGRTVSALDFANKAWSIRQRTGSGFLRADHLAVLITLNQCIGRFDEASYWLNLLDKKNQIECMVWNFAKARGCLLRGKIEEAIRLYREITRAGQSLSYDSAVAKRANLMLALLDRKYGFSCSSLEMLSYLSLGTIENLQVSILSEVYRDSDRVDKTEADKLLGTICQYELYDPLWFLVYAHIVRYDLKNAVQYLVCQYNMSSCFIRKCAQRYLASIPEAAKLLAKIKVEAGREYVRLTAESAEMITERDYQLLSDSDKASCSFFYDGVRGEIFVFTRRSKVRHTSVQARLLACLLLSRAQRVSAESLYEHVWESTYNEDFDLAVIKTTVVRLNKLLQSRSAPANIKIISISRISYIELNLPAGWQALLPLSPD
ncbi:MAG: hypothetical protein ACD_39C00095G0004 [uncultured bacterium]|nr:MAG: hypothetical protein ACD_39C00095G0004 [uncultured bacterium]